MVPRRPAFPVYARRQSVRKTKHALKLCDFTPGVNSAGGQLAARTCLFIEREIWAVLSKLVRNVNFVKS